MAKEELGITEENEMIEMSEEELESVAGGGYDYDRYNEIYDSDRSLSDKAQTFSMNLNRVKNVLKNKDLPVNQRRDLNMELMHLQSLMKRLKANN